jgi:hypothetical protein
LLIYKRNRLHQPKIKNISQLIFRVFRITAYGDLAFCEVVKITVGGSLVTTEWCGLGL